MVKKGERGGIEKKSQVPRGGCIRPEVARAKKGRGRGARTWETRSTLRKTFLGQFQKRGQNLRGVLTKEKDRRPSPGQDYLLLMKGEESRVAIKSRGWLLPPGGVPGTRE